MGGYERTLGKDFIVLASRQNNIIDVLMSLISMVKANPCKRVYNFHP